MAFDNIKLEKGMYATEKSFSQVLEELDPSENYRGTPFEGLDAFGRQLKRFDIKVSGPNSDCIQKFFSTTQSAALFHEYVARAVRQGIEQANLLPQIVATTTRIKGMDYRTITSVPSEEDKSLKVVEEGATIPQTEVKTQENLVKLHKRGRMLVASYEAIKFQRIDLFTVTLRQIGAYIAQQQFKDAVDVLINGDGNDNPIETIPIGSTSLRYEDLLSLVNALDPYELNTIIAPPEMMVEMLKLEEFKNPQTGINFQGTGKMGHPLGANFIKSRAVDPDLIIGLDKRCSLEMIVASDVTVDYDKLIDRQLERAAITTIAGFAKIFPDASKALGC
ncbi:MAG TPA: phage major capsid protein [Clostridiales bacterium]|nr:phage major capsid protein [Clostridiales bacterium]